MKYLSLVYLLIISHVSFSQNEIRVTIKNIDPQSGSIRVGLFSNEKDFLKNAIEGKVVKVTGREAEVVFNNLENGDYAVSIIHDENENGELDTNFIGIPTEGFAFGNNAMGTFGPPSFEKSKVTLKGAPVYQNISMKYM